MENSFFPAFESLNPFFFISVSLLQFPITTLPSAPSLSYPEPSVSHLSLCSVVISCCPHASPIERVYGLSISIYFSINPSSWSLNGTLHSALFQCCTDNSHTAHTQFITFMHPCGLMEWCTPKTQWPKTWVLLTEWLGMCVPHSLYCFFPVVNLKLIRFKTFRCFWVLQST